MHPALAVHGALARGAFAVAVLVSLAVLFAPGDGVPSAPPGVDKVVHLALFAALAVTGLWAGVRPAVLAALLVLYAAGSEVVQALTPLERAGSVADWAADVVGVVAGLLLWAGLHRRPSA
ncbi:VanZ family protein [Geodermatophilus sabuli]|uniref:VanZ family protein n=1 Tax=Geodermatophilus sabuli TaxID=1564158 RepID=A0A7K3W088_9ACTN|nr:VanZ family protein [Geodermatophilus sabuli]NEK57584.1 VanZ family protein [Geodermatophilus sabuli]